MALNNTGEISLGGSNAPTSVNLELSKVATAIVSLNDTDVRRLAGIVSGQISMSDLRGKSNYINPTIRAIIGFGASGTALTQSNTVNLISSTGGVNSDTTGVGTTRMYITGSGYGNDKAVFAFGTNGGGISAAVSIKNLISNTGTVTADESATGVKRYGASASSYGGDKAIYVYGWDTSPGGQNNIRTLVTNTGVFGSDATSAGSKQYLGRGAKYGGDKAIIMFGFYSSGGSNSNVNLISNTGVVMADTSTVGVTSKYQGYAMGYGNTKAIYYDNNIINLVTDTGAVGSDTAVTGVGSKIDGAAATYGNDKGIFGFGKNNSTGVSTNKTNLVTNTGSIGADSTGVGSSRVYCAGAPFGN